MPRNWVLVTKRALAPVRIRPNLAANSVRPRFRAGTYEGGVRGDDSVKLGSRSAAGRRTCPARTCPARPV